MWGPNDFFPTEIGTQLPSCSCQPLQPGHRRDMCHQACPTGAAQGLLLCLNWLDRVRLKSVGLNCVGSSFDGPCTAQVFMETPNNENSEENKTYRKYAALMSPILKGWLNYWFWGSKVYIPLWVSQVKTPMICIPLLSLWRSYPGDVMKTRSWMSGGQALILWGEISYLVMWGNNI